MTAAFGWAPLQPGMNASCQPNVWRVANTRLASPALGGLRRRDRYSPRGWGCRRHGNPGCPDNAGASHSWCSPTQRLQLRLRAVHPRFTSFPLYFSPKLIRIWVSSSFSPSPSPRYIQDNFNNQDHLKNLSYSFFYTTIKTPGIQPDKQMQEVCPNMLIFFTGGLHSFHNNWWGEEKIYS